MRAATVTPTGESRTFDINEVIVSKTDPRGRITYVNDVFLKVSCYPEDQLIGQPHNIIRHPDMPRGAFALLWDELKAGREIFAYVNNLAADGVSYWVLAHMTPTFKHGEIVGYHSNRRVPTREAVAAIEPVYRTMSAIEARHSNPRDAIEASSAYLGQVLDERGQNYDRFVWSLTKGM